MVKKIKFAKVRDKINGWKIDHEQLKSVRGEYRKTWLDIELEQVEDVILSLISLGYLNAENEK